MDNSRLQQLLNFYEQGSDDAFILFAIAKEYEKAYDLKSALSYYLELKTRHKEYVGLYYHLAKLYEEIEQVEMALQTYKKGINVAESQKDLHALSELKNAKLNLELEEGL